MKHQTINEKLKAHSAPRASGCIEWILSTDSYGYGKFKWRGRSFAAHRASYECENGAIPDGLEILHTCDNPSCINPAHLIAGTHADNMRDMAQKGRDARAPKITASQALAIRTDARAQRAIAKEYGLSQSQVGRIKRAEHWARAVQGGEN